MQWQLVAECWAAEGSLGTLDLEFPTAYISQDLLGRCIFNSISQQTGVFIFSQLCISYIIYLIPSLLVL